MSNLTPFEFDDALWLVDTGLYHTQQKTLILADLHLGYEESMRRGGIMLPETHLADIVSRIDQMIAAVSEGGPIRLIIDGDLRHTFGPLNPSEWKELNAFFDHVVERCESIIVIQGNHDPALNVFANRYENVEVCAQWIQQGWLFTHGDNAPELTTEVDHIVIGHEHPALTLSDSVTGRREKFKVFLKGEYEGRTLWVLPSCNALIQGTDLSRDGVLSPFLKDGVWQGCEVFLRDDGGNIYPFGPINQLT